MLGRILSILFFISGFLFDLHAQDHSFIKLNSGWSYSWKTSLNDSPSEWSSILEPINPSDRKGRSSVWFEIQLPGEKDWNDHWKEPSIFIENGYQDFQVFKAGQLIYNSASESKKKPFFNINRWNMIPLETEDAGKTIDFLVSSKDSANIGFSGSVLLGENSGLIRLMVRNDLPYMITGTFFVLVGILLLVIMFFTRKEQMLLLMALGFFALTGGLYTLTLTSTKQMIWDQPSFWFYLKNISLLFFPVGIAIFVEETFGGRYRFVMKFLWVLNIVFAVFVIDGIFRNPEFLTLPLLIPFYILVVVQLTISVFMVVQESIKGSNVALIFNVGLGIFGAALLYDIGRNILIRFKTFEFLRDSGSVWAYPFGMFFFLITLAVILTRRFVENHYKLENYSKELEEDVAERTTKLQKLNHELQSEIEERTRAEEALRNTNEKLRVRNEIMENELTMAREIQYQLIPSESPSPNISFFYQPMDQVGGDFYDFIRFQDQHNIGIFLSDVSGHGVPAAFITSMIKSYIQRSVGIQDNPAELLTYLNEALFKQTGGNFITAFYGIYNQKTRKFTYANAGHNVPYIISSDSGGNPEPLDTGAKGIPLAVLSSGDIDSMKKNYVNRTALLGKDSKLFLYTDGLVEAVNVEDKKKNESTDDFETAGFSLAVSENRHLPAVEFVQKIIERLVEFRGSDKFEDDVCMICVDVA